MDGIVTYSKKHLVAAVLITVVAMLAFGIGWKYGVNRPVPLVGGDTVLVSPATGIEGYDVSKFACDPDTTIKGPLPGPDVLGGLYQMTRTKDNRPESVTLLLAEGDARTGKVTLAKHYYNADVNGKTEQQSEDGVVNKTARDCTYNRAKP